MGGDFLRGTAMAQGVVNIPEAEKIIITMITDNLADATRLDYKIAKRQIYISNPLDSALHGEHGLAYQIETVVNGESHTCLFDFGSDPRGMIRNMDLLKIDCKKVEALGLSHDHWDHEAAFVEILKAKKEDFSKGIPLYIGEQFFVGTYSKRPNGSVTQINVLKKEDIEGLGFIKIVEIKDPTPIIPGAYLPGRIEQVTEYEKVAPDFRGQKREANSCRKRLSENRLLS